MKNNSISINLLKSSWDRLPIPVLIVEKNEIIYLNKSALLFFGETKTIVNELKREYHDYIIIESLVGYEVLYIDTVKIEQKKLFEAEQLFKKLNDASIESIIQHENGVIIDVNKACETMFGYIREELIGQSVLKITHEDSINTIVKNIKDKVETPYEANGITKEGKIIHGLVSGKELNIQGRNIRVTCIHDITALKASENKILENKALYKNLVLNMPDGLIIFKDGIINFINPAIYSLLEVDDKFPILGKNVLDFVLPQYHEKAIEAISLAQQGNEVHFSDYQIKCPNGTVKDVVIRGVPIEYGSRFGIMAVIHDLSTEKRVMEEALRVSSLQELNNKLQKEIDERIYVQQKLIENQRFTKDLMESSIDIVMSTKANTEVIEFNQAALNAFGYNAEEFKKVPAPELFKDPNQHKTMVKVLNTQGYYRGEIINKKKDGTFFICNLSASVLKDANGNIIGSMGISRDITEQKEQETKLRESEERYKAIFNQIFVGIAQLNRDAEFLHVNDKLCSILGYSKEELLGKKEADLIYKEDINEGRKELEDLLFGKIDSFNVEKRLINKEGKIVYLSITVSAIKSKSGLISYFLAVYQDITQIITDSEKLHFQSSKLAAIFKGSTHLIWTVDSLGIITSFNSNFAEYVYKKFGIIVDPYTTSARKIVATDAEMVTFWNEKYKSVFKGNVEQFEFKLTSKKGEANWIEIYLHPIYNVHAEVTEVSCIGNDITQRKNNELALLNQKAKLNAIIESTSHLIWTIDKKNNITSYNSNFLKQIILLGADPKAKQYNFKDIFSQDHCDTQQWIKAIELAFKGKSLNFETRILYKNMEMWREVFIEPIKHENKVVELSCIAHDITAKKEAEKNLMLSLQEKEVLLREVHHRVKNNLQVISSILNLQSGFVKDKATLEMLQESQNRIKSMSFIHEALYQTKDFSQVNFSEYLKNIVQNLVRSYELFENKISLKFDIEEVYLSLDTSIPCGLILNELVSNAIKYAYPKDKKGDIFISLKQKNKEVSIVIQDFGVGVPKDFVIEDSPSLGLQLVVALVEQVNGNLTLERGGGTKFIIKFNNQN